MRRTITMTLMALALSGVAVSSVEAQRRVIIRSRPVYVAPYYDPFWNPWYDPFWGSSYYVPKTPEQIQADREASHASGLSGTSINAAVPSRPLRHNPSIAQGSAAKTAT